MMIFAKKVYLFKNKDQRSLLMKLIDFGRLKIGSEFDMML